MLEGAIPRGKRNMRICVYSDLMTVNVAVAGASGYAGGELLRLLAGHPKFRIRAVTAQGNAGQRLASVHPQLASLGELELLATTPENLSTADLVFLALPHGASAAIVNALPGHIRVVDLGADFRLQSTDAWSTYYPGSPHAGHWTYGLPELVDRSVISAASRVANPGCYATAIALGFAPILQHVDASDLTVVAASGTSGAGRKATESLLASEVMGSMSAYKVGGVHQHTPEIEQTLAPFTNSEVRLSFTPLLAPMSRGILATLTAKATDPAAANVHDLLASFYDGEPFVRVLPIGEQPTTAATYGSNVVLVQGAFDAHTNRVVITVAIDNLVKGAAGQALQNANLMHDLDESAGLSTIGVAP